MTISKGVNMHTKSKKLTWSNANLQNSAERNALFQQEEKKLGNVLSRHLISSNLKV